MSLPSVLKLTHSGQFHADDVMCGAIATLAGYRGPVLRTRSESLIVSADMVWDVGGVHHPATHRYDHHQPGGAGAGPTGVPFASAGLMWQSLGEAAVLAVFDAARVPLTPGDVREIAGRVYGGLIQYIDSIDNGIAVKCPRGFSVAGIISQFMPPWFQAQNDDALHAGYDQAELLATAVLRNAILHAGGSWLAIHACAQGIPEEQGKLLVLPRSLPWQETVVRTMPNVLYVMYEASGDWRVHAVPSTIGGFNMRKALPRGWAGLETERLSAITGVPDTVFCHNNRHLAAARSQAGARQLAKLALAA